MVKSHICSDICMLTFFSTVFNHSCFGYYPFFIIIIILMIYFCCVLFVLFFFFSRVITYIVVRLLWSALRSFRGSAVVLQYIDKKHSRLQEAKRSVLNLHCEGLRVDISENSPKCTIYFSFFHTKTQNPTSNVCVRALRTCCTPAKNRCEFKEKRR